MIKYNPKNWYGLIFEFHKSDTLRKLLKTLILFGIYCTVIVYLELHYTKFKSTIAIHSLLGFVIVYYWFLGLIRLMTGGGKEENYGVSLPILQET